VALDNEKHPADLRHALTEVRVLGHRLEVICEALLAYARTVLPEPAALARLDLEPIIDASEIFARFFSGTHSGQPQAEGRPGRHGLGLAICRSIMRSHGGDVTHQPTPGGGATFEARFPQTARGQG
jgi:hypothetical protein